MYMWRSKLILGLTVVLVGAAGLTVGRLSVTPSNPSAAVQNPQRHGDRRPPQPDWMAELGLSASQHTQIDSIWSDMWAQMHTLDLARRKAGTDHEQAIKDLFTPEQLAKFEQINKDYKDQQAALDANRQKVVDGANQKTRDVLDDTQKKTFDDMSRQGQFRARGGRGTQGGRNGTRNSSLPATLPAGNNPAGNSASTQP